MLGIVPKLYEDELFIHGCAGIMWQKVLRPILIL